MNRIVCGILALLVFLAASFAAEPDSGAGRSNVVTLLIAFPYSGDPVATDIEKSFRFALSRNAPQLPVEVVRVTSAHEAALVCDELMKPSSPTALLAFAGDAGAATVVALQSAKYQMPVLKLTGDTRSSAAFSGSLFEFLPSMEQQAEELAKFAAAELKMESCVILAPDDARGRSLAEGFRQGAEHGKAAVVGERFYFPDVGEIRRDANLLLTDEKRLAHRSGRSEASLSPEERAQMFGDARNGEVLFAAERVDSSATGDVPLEGLFFGLTPEHVDIFPQQLPALPKGTFLLGNSSWLNLDALIRQQSVVDGIFISLPLVPRAADSAEYWDAYEESVNRDASDWERLGLDAGQFVSQILAGAPRDRAELIRRLSEAQFSGRAVRVDFSGGRENPSVRVARFYNRELQLVH